MNKKIRVIIANDEDGTFVWLPDDAGGHASVF